MVFSVCICNLLLVWRFWDQVEEFSSLLSSFESQESNLGQQARQQEPLPSEPSYQP